MAGNSTALVTGANSGIGFEASAQLALAGYDRVVLACRTADKADDARARLVERLGRDPFETLVVEATSVDSSEAAAREIVRRGLHVDALVLNAGMVPGAEIETSEAGVEMCFASSLIGHHVIAVRMLAADLLPQGARIVISGSESARDDLPGIMDMKHYPFTKGPPEIFGADLPEAMRNFALAQRPDAYDSLRYYAVTKVFVTWWAAAMDRRFGDRVRVYAVSPGMSLATNAGRHATGFNKLLFTKVLPAIGSMIGMDAPVPVAAKRYVDVITDSASYRPGRTYTSAPEKLVGPLFEMTYPHMLDEVRQELAWDLLVELTGVGGGAVPS